jgi:hypothetical protein
MPRPARSTAKFISYDLRPAKQSERGMLVDVLKIGGDCGLGIREYRYVGMGANRFYDFMLLHKYLGVRDMVSLEHDEDMYARAVYSVPYRFIDVRHTTVIEFLANDRTDKPEILWLDYDGGIGPDIVADIMNMAGRLKQGDFCFITVSGPPPRVLDRSSDAERLTHIRETMGDVAGEVTLEDVERSSFPLAVHKILYAAFRNAFATRRDGTFVPLVQVEYADSMPMVTLGGALLSDGAASAYRRRMKLAFPYLSTDVPRLYDIRSFNLTERERSLFDRASTAQTKRSPEWNALKKLGFKEADFKAYNELIRYLPRYVETIV